MDITMYFQSLLALSGLNVLISAFVGKFTKFTGTAAQIQSWVVAIATAVLGNQLGLGIFADLSLVWSIAVGFGVGLSSNGVFDIGIVQQLLELIKLRDAKK